VIDPRLLLLQDIVKVTQRCFDKAVRLRSKDPYGFIAPMAEGALVRSSLLWMQRIEEELDECLDIIEEQKAMEQSRASCSDACDQTEKSVLPAQTGM
jgi:hypothetical protein